MNNILITGATGFVGRVLVDRVLESHREVRVALRQNSPLFSSEVDKIIVESLGEKTDWSAALEQVDTIVHLAARVHVMNDHSLNPLEEFRKVNTEGTLNLARQAEAAGVKRFILSAPSRSMVSLQKMELHSLQWTRLRLKILMVLPSLRRNKGF